MQPAHFVPAANPLFGQGRNRATLCSFARPIDRATQLGKPFGEIECGCILSGDLRGGFQGSPVRVVDAHLQRDQKSVIVLSFNSTRVLLPRSRNHRVGPR